MMEKTLFKKIVDFIVSLVECLIVALIISFILLRFVFLSVVVDGSSMNSTLRDGDKGFALKVNAKKNIERFDIVVIDESKLLVKRVIGLPNETIEYIDNKLYVNGNYIEEEFLDNDTFTSNFRIELSDDEYYCLGDNRSVSKDSRYYGPFNLEQIDARGVFIIYPFERLGVKK